MRRTRRLAAEARQRNSPVDCFEQRRFFMSLLIDNSCWWKNINPLWIPRHLSQTNHSNSVGFLQNAISLWNHNHQLNWWFAQALKGLPIGSPTKSRHWIKLLHYYFRQPLPCGCLFCLFGFPLRGSCWGAKRRNWWGGVILLLSSGVKLFETALCTYTSSVTLWHLLLKEKAFLSFRFQLAF